MPRMKRGARPNLPAQILSKFDTFRRQFASQAFSSPLLCFTTDKKEIEMGLESN